MPGEEFIKAGDIGRELGFVSMGTLDVFVQDQRGESVLRSIHGETLELPTVVGEISFFLSTVQPHKVSALPHSHRCFSMQRHPPADLSRC